MVRGGAQRLAAEHGMMLVSPDTSPRDADVPGEDEDWDFGTGAGFYVDATEGPWSRHYRMYSYVTRELPSVVAENFPARTGAAGIFGHSMGGHGALACAPKDPHAQARGRWELRALYGRPRRPRLRLEEPRRLRLGLGLRPHLGPDPRSVGREGLVGLPRGEQGGLEGLRPERTARRGPLPGRRGC